MSNMNGLLKSEELKKVLAVHPDLPIIFFCDSDIWGDDNWPSWTAQSMTVRIGKVFTHDTFEQVFTDKDRDDFVDALYVIVEDSDEAYGKSKEEIHRMVEEKEKELESEWKECIIVKLGV